MLFIWLYAIMINHSVNFIHGYKIQLGSRSEARTGHGSK
jgi:hypothetical protein